MFSSLLFRVVWILVFVLAGVVAAMLAYDNHKNRTVEAKPAVSNEVSTK